MTEPTTLNPTTLNKDRYARPTIPSANKPTTLQAAIEGVFTRYAACSYKNIDETPELPREDYRARFLPAYNAHGSPTVNIVVLPAKDS
jgi:hypothetical protein